jgi:hypothetical protein
MPLASKGVVSTAFMLSCSVVAYMAAYFDTVIVLCLYNAINGTAFSHKHQRAGSGDGNHQ